MVGIWLLRGEDEALVADALHDLVQRLVGPTDRSLMVDEFASDDYELGAVIDAAQTMPFFTDRRVVVAREISRFSADQLSAVTAYLSDPMETADLVMTTTSGRLPKSMLEGLKKSGGHLLDTDPPTKAKDRQGWYDEQFAASGVKLDPGAKVLVMSMLGEDVGRLGAILDTLVSSFTAGTRLTALDVEPFLGSGGSVPPWDLTDAIDRGATAEALDKLSRMMSAGERHPLQMMATLHGHYTRMLKLDGAGVTEEREAAALLGMKGSTFPARKALDQSRRLGSVGIMRAIDLLAKADLDLRGATDWPGELVLEVVVARLSKLAPQGARRR